MSLEKGIDQSKLPTCRRGEAGPGQADTTLCHTTIFFLPDIHLPTNMSTITLPELPTEILELIAYFAATQEVLGPPTSLAALLGTSRALHDKLSLVANPLLYASIFEAKFDLGAIRRRYGADFVTMSGLASELQRRFRSLRHIRSMHGALAGEKDTTQSVLSVAYIMMLEDDGKNKRQLCEYAGFSSWLQRYWSDETGASVVKRCWRTGRWPPLTPENALAMWLYWMILKPSKHQYSQKPLL
jgi:hypothetical protein